jgi:hypothetical protein
MEHSPCEDHEDIVKGLVSETYDSEAQLLSPSLFKGKGSSYSRLCVYSIEKIINIFLSQLHKPPQKFLKGYAILNVGRIRSVAREYKNPETKLTVELEVIPVPVPDNDAHAETHPKVPATLAIKIAEQCVHEMKHTTF